jgi:hypothetical protein
MQRFWRSRDPVERLLEDNRPVPRDEFVASMLDRLGERPRRSRGRLVLAGALTALAGAAAVAAGAVGSASSGAGSLASVARHAVSPAPVVLRASAPAIVNLTPSTGGGSGSAQGSAGEQAGGSPSGSTGSSGGPAGSSSGVGALIRPGGGEGGISSAASQQSAPQVEINGVVYRTTANHLRDPSLFEYYQCVQIGRVRLYLPPWLAAWLVNHVRFARYCSVP